MSLLMIGLVVTVSLVIVPSVVPNIVEYVRNRRDVRCDGVRGDHSRMGANGSFGNWIIAVQKQWRKNALFGKRSICSHSGMVSFNGSRARIHAK